MPADVPSDGKPGAKKPPATTRSKRAKTANSTHRERPAKSIAAILRQALDAPASGDSGNGRPLTNRELMIRGLVERSAAADLAATKLLFELLRNADPRALAADPAEADPFGADALAILKQRLARLARAQSAQSAAAASPPDTTAPPDPTISGDPPDVKDDK